MNVLAPSLNQLSTRPLARFRLASLSLIWPLLLVLGLAALLRAWNITTWSMWEDEEGSLWLAQKPYEGFQGFFPVFFVALNQFLRLTGLSVGAARLIPGAMGLLSILLTYSCFRRFVSPAAALLAALFLAVNLGHLFWSQSIRYYTMVLVFQILSMYWFLDGFERDRPGALLLSNLAFLLALLTHFSALLLAPVFVGYLALVIWTRECGTGYRTRNYLLFGLVLCAILATFAWRFVQLQSMIGGWAIPSARDPVYVGATVLVYFGLPLVILGLLAPWLARGTPRRVLLFLLSSSLIPVLELLVIAQLNVVNVTWYYALVALPSFALLAAAVLLCLWRSGRHGAAGVLGGVSLLYYATMLTGYFTVMHGDRPRWEEATLYLRQTTEARPGSPSNPEIFAQVPRVVAYYLGANLDQPESYELVKVMPEEPPASDGARERWYVVEAKSVSPSYRDWFADHCTLQNRFEARTGPVDRSVLVYRCKSGAQRSP